MYSISRRYKVEVVDIVQLNPGVANNLAVGTELRIPSSAIASKSTDPKKDSSISKPNTVIDLGSLFGKNDYSKYIDSKKPIRIAFLLPFMLDHGNTDPSVDRFVDFYAGALLAIQNAKQKGISLEIFTYDTEKSEAKVTEVLNNSELKTMDLIIGPAYSNQVSFVGNFAKAHRINTLIPFTSKVPDIDNNPYLFQFNPGSDTEIKFSADLLTSKYKNSHIVFAELPGVSSLDGGKIWADALQVELKKEHTSFSILELTTSDNANYKSVLKKGEKNLIIFNTDKYAYISPFIASLQSHAKEFDIVLFEQYSWKNQNGKLRSRIYISPFISILDSMLLNKFNNQFTQYFKRDVITDSPRYDLLGYDLSNYFITIIHRNGNKFTEKLDTFNFTNGIQSQPLFQRSSRGSGFINQRIYLGEDR